MYFFYNFCTAVNKKKCFTHIWQKFPLHLFNVLTLPSENDNITFHTFIMHSLNRPIIHCIKLNDRPDGIIHRTECVAWLLEQSLIDDAVDQWQTRLRACVRASCRHFKHTLWLSICFLYTWWTLCFTPCLMQRVIGLFKECIIKVWNVMFSFSLGSVSIAV